MTGLKLAAAHELDFGNNKKRDIIGRLRLFDEEEKTLKKDEEALVNLRASFNSAFSRIPAVFPLQPTQLFDACEPSPTDCRGTKRARSDAIYEVTPPSESRALEPPVPYQSKRTYPRFMPLRIISSPDVAKSKDKAGKPVKHVAFGCTMSRSPSYEEFSIPEEVFFKPVASAVAYPRGDHDAFRCQDQRSAFSAPRKNDYSASMAWHFRSTVESA